MNQINLNNIVRVLLTMGIIMAIACAFYTQQNQH